MAGNKVRKGNHPAKNQGGQRRVPVLYLILSLLCAALLFGVLGFVLGRLTANRDGAESSPESSSGGPPSIAHVEYSTTEKTSEPVVATLVFDDDREFTVLGDGQMTYTFRKNGIHVFKFKDGEDNVIQIRACVTWRVSSDSGGE